VRKDKPNLNAFSDQESLVCVIRLFNAIEHSLTDILIKEIGAPKKKQAFLKDILFNNAILPFAAKVRLFRHLRATKDWPKIDPNLFHRLMHIRNQFAHSQRSLNITLLVGEKLQCGGSKIMMSSVNGSGQLVEVNVADAFNEFRQLWVKLSKYLRELNTKA
jgi:hypothetical protein